MTDDFDPSAKFSNRRSHPGMSGLPAVAAEDLTDTTGLDTLDTAPLDLAVAEYNKAAPAVIAAAFKQVKAAVLAVYPDAQAYVLLGVWNEDGETRLSLDEVWTASAGRCSVDDGNDAIEHVEEAVEEALMWIGGLTGDDYEGRHVVRLVADDVVIDGLED